MALVAGKQAVPDRIMGHAGAFVGPFEGDAHRKALTLQRSGVTMTNHPSKFGKEMAALLGQRQSSSHRLERPFSEYGGSLTNRSVDLGAVLALCSRDGLWNPLLCF